MRDIDGKTDRQLKGHISVINSLAWSPDGKQIASVGGDGTLRLWWTGNGTPGEVLGVYQANFRWSDSLTWSSDGKQIVAITADRLNVRFWSTDGKPGAFLKGDTNGVWAAVFSPDGKRIATANSDNTVRVWRLDGTAERTLHHAGVGTVAWSPDGKWLASAGAFGKLRLWGSDGTKGPVLEGHEHEIRSIAWNPDSKQLASGSFDPTVRLWNVDGTAGPVLKTSRGVYPVAWSPDGKQIAAGTTSFQVGLWEADGKPIGSLRSISVAFKVAWSPDGQWLAVGERAGGVRLWRADGTPGPVFHTQNNPVHSLAWSPDSKRLIAKDHGHTLYVWNIDSREREWTGVDLRDGTAATFSPAGQLLHGSPGTVEKHFRYIVETDSGQQQLLKPSEFRELIAKGAKPAPKGPPQTARAKPWQPTPEQQAFFDAVAKLGPEQQIEVVRERLKLVNPGFDGKLEHKIVAGKVTELKLPQPGLEHLWPIAALGTLERLDTTGTAAADFPPLARLPLKQLRIDLELYNEPVAQVVRGMKTLQTINGVPAAEYWSKFAAQQQEIERARCTAAAWSADKRLAFVRRKLVELNPEFDGKLESTIEGGRVVELQFITDEVTDISPVRALPRLERLFCNSSLGGRLADLSPLQGMKLTDLSCFYTRITDLSPLKGMKLTDLRCDGTRVADLSPLQGMPLTYLQCSLTRVADLSPLKGLPLTGISYDVRLYHPADETLLKSLPLKTVWSYLSGNLLPVAEFWKQLAARRQAAEEFVESVAKLPAEKQIEAVRSRLAELNPNVPATLGAKVADETVTEATLALNKHPHDLTPLMAFGGLKKLTITGGADWLDLSHVKILPLEALTCLEPIARKNAPVMAEIKTLKTINGRPAEEFWKQNASGTR